MFKNLTSHQSIETYTCLNCDKKSHKPDDRNIFLQPLTRENENQTLNEIISGAHISSCEKICESCNVNGLHQKSEELFILPSVLIINLQRFVQSTAVEGNDFQKRRKSMRLAGRNNSADENIIVYEKNCIKVEPSSVLILKETIYSLRSLVIHDGKTVEEEGGHIFTLLNTSKGWITCDDTKVSLPTRSLPIQGQQGYLFIYEKMDDILPPPVIDPVATASTSMQSGSVLP